MFKYTVPDPAFRSLQPQTDAILRSVRILKTKTTGRITIRAISPVRRALPGADPTGTLVPPSADGIGSGGHLPTPDPADQTGVPSPSSAQVPVQDQQPAEPPPAPGISGEALPSNGGDGTNQGTVNQ